jgi:hypothetical protein
MGYKVLTLTKSGVWGCVQDRTQWSTEFGDAGNGTSCVCCGTD